MKRAGEIFRVTFNHSRLLLFVLWFNHTAVGTGIVEGAVLTNQHVLAQCEHFNLKIKWPECNFILSKNKQTQKKVKRVEHNHFSLRTPHTPLHSGKSVYCPLLDFREFRFSLARTVSEVHLRTSQTSGQAAAVPCYTQRPTQTKETYNKIKRALHLVCMSTTITPPVLQWQDTDDVL